MRHSHLEDRAEAPTGAALCHCPHCGSAVPPQALEPDAALASLDLPPMTEVIVRLLARRIGQWVHLDRITDAVWGHCEDGGPIDPANNIDSRLSQARRALHAAGFTTEGTWHQRRLVRLTIA